MLHTHKIPNKPFVLKSGLLQHLHFTTLAVSNINSHCSCICANFPTATIIYFCQPPMDAEDISLGGQWADSFYYLPDFVYSGICIFIWLFEDIQMAICVLIPTYCRLADKGRKENSGKLERRRGNPNVAEHPSSLIIYALYVSVEHCFSTFTYLLHFIRQRTPSAL